MAKIRHIAIFTLKDQADRPKIAKALETLCARVRGFTSCAYGLDAGLKSGNADFGVSFDFADAVAYRRWDTDAEHERIRQEQIYPLVKAVARIQFQLAD